nr:reverse transcriptase domain-containing protein [Tanacetum cinerariifolium]
MSSPNHPTSDIEDAFSSNSRDYTLASSDYFLASLGNTSSDSSNNSYGLVPIPSPTLPLFHDDPYMKVMHAYDTIMPPQVPIPSPIIVPPSLVLSQIFNPQDFFVLEELLPPKEQVTPAMTQAVIGKLVADSVATTLEAQAANMANADTKPREAHVARKCSYKEFMSCQPFNFKGTEGAIGLICWCKRTDSVLYRRNYTEDCKVKYATSTLTEEALSWWNSFTQPIGIEEAYKITWSEFKKLLIKKYCP